MLNSVYCAAHLLSVYKATFPDDVNRECLLEIYEYHQRTVHSLYKEKTHNIYKICRYTNVAKIYSIMLYISVVYND